jgi:hypothetical protein
MSDVKHFNALLQRYHIEKYIPTPEEGVYSADTDEHLQRVYFFPDLNSIVANANKFMKLALLKVPMVFRLHRADVQFLEGGSHKPIDQDVSFGSIFTNGLSKRQKFALTVPVSKSTVDTYGAKTAATLAQHALLSFQLRYVTKDVKMSLREIGFRVARSAIKIAQEVLGKNYWGAAQQFYDEAKAAHQDLPDFSQLHKIQFIHRTQEGLDEYRKNLPWAAIRAAVFTRKAERDMLLEKMTKEEEFHDAEEELPQSDDILLGNPGKNLAQIRKEHTLARNVQWDSFGLISPGMKKTIKEIRNRWRTFTGSFGTTKKGEVTQDTSCLTREDTQYFDCEEE